jgi:DnaK suppressor protein
MSQGVSNQLVQECKQKLLTMKSDLLNRIRISQNEFITQEKASGDEIYQAVAQLAEDSFLISQDRLRRQILEIEFALARIQNGSFGICEETQEPIETERLLAIPYTRLSIEGAEMREAMNRRFAR